MRSNFRYILDSRGFLPGLGALVSLWLLPLLPAGAERFTMSLNDGWRYSPEATEFAETMTFDDSKWERVQVPHTWNAKDPFDDEPGYRRGHAWYRKQLHLDPSLAGKRIFLRFEGVHQAADLYVAGQHVGQHRGGYTAFQFDITRFLLDKEKTGPKGIVALRADSSWQEDIAPVDIGFAHYGGLYRDVWLVATDPVHFDMTDHGSSGIFADTPEVSAERGVLRVRGRVSNDSETERAVSVRLVLQDPAGKKAGETTVALKVPAGQKGPFESRIEVERPALWSPATPKLYTLVSTIVDGAKELDELKTEVGFRWFSFDPDEGFRLNGQKLFLKGVSRHQDVWDMGSAVRDSIHRRDLEFIKDMGCNFLRLAHYPQDPEVLAMCDRMGLLVWEEIPIVSHVSSSRRFVETSSTMLREMIRQHYNHPSVIMWGTQNETLLRWQQTLHRFPEYFGMVLGVLKELDALARREDPGRATTLAIHEFEDNYEKAGIASVPQVLGWNLYAGWYAGEFERFGLILDSQHKRFPERVLFVSEYGAGSDSRLSSERPQRFDHSVEWMAMFHESHLRQSMARPYLAGIAIWSMFDFSQPGIGETMIHINQKGMMTFDRRHKDVFFMYRANWNPEPMVHIATRERLRRCGTGNGTVAQDVKIYSNLAGVELFHDGNSLGLKRPDDVKSAVWKVPFRDGWNELEARGMHEGKELRDVVRVHFTVYPEKLSDPAVPFREIAVNCGAYVDYADPEGLIWQADRPYRAGGWGYEGGIDNWQAIPKVYRKGISGTEEDPLFQTPREGVKAYRFDVPDGDYEVELRMTEYFEENGPGARVFRVKQGDKVLIHSIDLAKENGVLQAVSKTVHPRVEGGKGLTLTFEALAGKSTISGIRVRKLR